MEEKNDLEELQKKSEEYLNGWKRSQADFINYKKDEIKRFEEVLKFGNEILIRDILPVLDSLILAKEVPIKRQLEDILRKNGVEEIVVKIG
ncbi:MAG: nucleotide exchange factor GrpE, partial [Patescibacteria group bacterium]